MSDVDVIIAVHDSTRPIRRAVESVLAGGANARALVVCHNISKAEIASALGQIAAHPSVVLLECADGIPSPSGPFNTGLDAATAEFIAVLGSDDELEAGALSAWVTRARADRADAVLARIRHASGARILTPPVRPGRRRRLDPIADRLAYRSAPLGILSRARFGHVRYPGGLRTGEDIAYTVRTWFSGARLSLADAAPAYLVHDDARVRVTTAPRPLSVDAAAVKAVMNDEFFDQLSQDARRSVIIKLLRQNLSSWVLLRPRTEDWSAKDNADLREITRELMDAAPSARGLLSRRDAAIVDAALAGDGPRAADLAVGRSRPSFTTLMTPRLRDALNRDAPLRFALATVLLRFGR